MRLEILEVIDKSRFIEHGRFKLMNGFVAIVSEETARKFEKQGVKIREINLDDANYKYIFVRINAKPGFKYDPNINPENKKPFAIRVELYKWESHGRRGCIPYLIGPWQPREENS